MPQGSLPLQEATGLTDHADGVKRTDKSTDAKINQKRAWASLQLGPAAFYYHGANPAQALGTVSPRGGACLCLSEENSTLTPG